MKKEHFILFMEEIKKSNKKLDKFIKHASKLFPDAFDANLIPSFYNIDEYINILTDIMNDNNEWIFYYVYDLDFGKNYKEGIVKNKNGDVELKTFEDLYDIIKDTK